MVGEFSLYYNTETPKLKQDIGAMTAMNVNGLRVSSDTKARDKNGELRVYHFLAVSLFGHLCASRQSLF